MLAFSSRQKTSTRSKASAGRKPRPAQLRKGASMQVIRFIGAVVALLAIVAEVVFVGGML